MKLHTLPKIVRRKRRRGRGIAKGGAKSGRGMKGQRARAGSTKRIGFEGGQTPLYMRLPKGRGTKQKFPSQVQKPVAITLSQLNAFEDGSIVGPGQLRKAGLVRNRADKVKIIGGGACKKKLTVRAHKASDSAKSAVESAGGKLEIIA